MECFFVWNEMPPTSATYFYDDLWCLIYIKKGNFSHWDFCWIIFPWNYVKSGTNRIASHEFVHKNYVCMLVREFAEEWRKNL